MKQICVELLDRAITKVVKEEYQRLTKGLSQEVIACKVNEALKALDGLSIGKQPDYNGEWVSLFYLAWYQPGHVRLAHDICRRFYIKTKNVSDLIDLGCGAYATNLGFVIAFAEKEAREEKMSLQAGPAIHGLDPSESMKKLDEALWLEFWQMVKCCLETPSETKHSDDKAVLAALYRRCDESNMVPSAWECHKPDPKMGSGVGILAMHVVYEENKTSLEETIECIHKRYSVRCMTVTCHWRKEPLALALLKLLQPDGKGICRPESGGNEF